ncbi:hypothetical protein, variant [Blastomyces dermatitidis ATCC 18188]|uniref:Uncharacterized protein n=1 Tax=Ajellomyces dermatitidis (strain ATCC 18188 / CBS 674.68) TaxID=653446 RepID=A0A0J9HHW6_AJEDA|nr:hypothetical protein BDDG_13006 [Blastomyces dermatitidis ATCC 18188]KMW68740.1 hypothetical protein, variant [Blastomyces dermatitidis ATCC 18188]
MDPKIKNVTSTKRGHGQDFFSEIEIFVRPHTPENPTAGAAKHFVISLVNAGSINQGKEMQWDGHWHAANGPTKMCPICPSSPEVPHIPGGNFSLHLSLAWPKMACALHSRFPTFPPLSFLSRSELVQCPGIPARRGYTSSNLPPFAVTRCYLYVYVCA